MSALPILVPLFGLMACGVLVALLVRWIGRKSAVEVGDAPRVVARRTAGFRWAGVTVSMIVAVIAARSGDLGVGLLFLGVSGS